MSVAAAELRAGRSAALVFLGFAFAYFFSALLRARADEQERPRNLAAAKGLAAAAGVFLVSLCFRTIDREICAAFPLGAHFLWHLLNALVLWLLLRTAILAR